MLVPGVVKRRIVAVVPLRSGLVSLDALAPDQRAVVQLVLQQDRSYEDLAGLLGISADAVRTRAHRGLAALAPTSDLAPGEHAALADYLLGQQSVSERQSSRSLLSESPAARAWAQQVAAELEPIARHPLPAIPDAPAAAAEPEPEPVAAGAATPAGEELRPRSRPRPRPDGARNTVTPTKPQARRRGRSDRLGGALLIGGVAVLLVAGIIVLLTNGSSDDGGTKSASSKASATPTATATAQFQPLGQLSLKSPTGGKAKGQMVIFANSSGGIAFTLQGTSVPASGSNEAYAVWLTGGDKPHRLGFAPQVKSDGKFGTSGPRDQDATKFAQWFSQAKNVVVSKETSENATSPGPTVLEGTIPTGTKSSGSG
jgi:hypothetical protein